MIMLTEHLGFGVTSVSGLGYAFVAQCEHEPANCILPGYQVGMIHGLDLDSCHSCTLKIIKNDVTPSSDISSIFVSFNLVRVHFKFSLTHMNIDPGILALGVADMGPIYHHNGPKLLAADNRIYLNEIKKILLINVWNKLKVFCH